VAMYSGPLVWRNLCRVVRKRNVKAVFRHETERGKATSMPGSAGSERIRLKRLLNLLLRIDQPVRQLRRERLFRNAILKHRSSQFLLWGLSFECGVQPTRKAEEFFTHFANTSRNRGVADALFSKRMVKAGKHSTVHRIRAGAALVTMLSKRSEHDRGHERYHLKPAFQSIVDPAGFKRRRVSRF